MKRHWLLIAILIIAAFLRLWQISDVPVSLFGDELDVGYHAYSLGVTGNDYSGNFFPLHLRSLAEWRTPLYIFSAIPTVMLFGITPLGVRLPAAIFGILSVWAIYLLTSKLTGNRKIGLISAFVLAISPWHIQYSRAAFEVTQMLFFLMMGMYLFLVSLERKRKWLWLSIVSFLLMPWIYSTAKLFVPLLLVFLAIVFKNRLIVLPKKHLVYTAVSGLVLGLPLVFNLLTGEGGQRFSTITIFDTQEAEAHIGEIRGLDAPIIERLFHNKYTYWGDIVLSNYLQSFSTEFLFNSGDVNPRHSIEGMGVLYRAEVIPLVVGLIYFFSSKLSWKSKAIVGFILLAGALPSALTEDGGRHATRLILTLPSYIILIAYGIYVFLSSKRPLNIILLSLYALILGANFLVYQHNYWFENPIKSQIWWHAGWSEAVQSIKSVENQYDRVFVSGADEPPLIFFAAWSEYPPTEWQTKSPLNNKQNVEDFGEVSYIDKYYFGDPQGGLYEWGQYLSGQDLYLVSANQVNVNLIKEPERTPEDLSLIETVAYPSGDPAFYLFSGKNEE